MALIDIFYYPLEVVITKIHADAGAVREYFNPLDCIQNIIQKDGLKGFYVGYSIKLLH
jgi:Mitochondrial carrier protein